MSTPGYSLSRLTSCTRCPRLVDCRESIRHKPARGFSPQDYWSKPVPAFGDYDSAKLMILGLAPGAHGANRSGRPFTGDAAGVWLYPTLRKFGFSNQATSTDVQDGLVLHEACITNIVKCVPPGNKPNPDEVKNCSPFFTLEMKRMAKLKVVLALGSIAHTGYLNWAKRQGIIDRLSPYPFAHGAEFALPNGQVLLDSYHCSRLNTNTGRLTLPMFEAVFARAREIIDG